MPLIVEDEALVRREMKYGVGEFGVVPLGRRQMPALAHGPYDLPDQIELVKKQALIIHEQLGNPPDYQ